MKTDYLNDEKQEGKVRDGLLLVPACRFCGGPTQATQNNGVIGPGYREWNRVCKHCGKHQ